MNRRDFLKRLGGAAAAVALSPLLDLAPIEAAPEAWGIPALLNDGACSGTYLGLDRSAFPFWRGAPLGATCSRPLTLEVLNGYINRLALRYDNTPRLS